MCHGITEGSGVSQQRDTAASQRETFTRAEQRCYEHRLPRPTKAMAMQATDDEMLAAGYGV